MIKKTADRTTVKLEVNQLWRAEIRCLCFQNHEPGADAGLRVRGLEGLQRAAAGHGQQAAEQVFLSFVTFDRKILIGVQSLLKLLKMGERGMGCSAQRKHSCFSPSGPRLDLRHCQEFSLDVTEIY